MADTIAYVAGFFLMLSFAPQVIKTMRTQSVEDISLLLLIFTLISSILYEIYALLLNLVPIIVMNGVFTLLVCWELILALRYRHPS